MIALNSLDEVIELIKGYAFEEGRPIDGIVFKFNNCKYYESLGATDHHFRGGLAFKFYDETYQTNLIDILFYFFVVFIFFKEF